MKQISAIRISLPFFFKSCIVPSDLNLYSIGFAIKNQSKLRTVERRRGKYHPLPHHANQTPMSPIIVTNHSQNSHFLALSRSSESSTSGGTLGSTGRTGSATAYTSEAEESTRTLTTSKHKPCVTSIHDHIFLLKVNDSDR